LPIATLMGLAAGCVGAKDKATEPIVVETASGRVFAGQIDIRTSREVLVLRTGTRNVTIVRPIDSRFSPQHGVHEISSGATGILLVSVPPALAKRQWHAAEQTAGTWHYSAVDSAQQGGA
jgi:hypothetical protein